MHTDPDALKPWELLHAEPAFETPYFKIQKQEIRTPSGATTTFYIHDVNDAVM